MSETRFIILINLIMLFASNIYCFAFDNNITHRDITNMAVTKSSINGYLISTLVM